MEIRIRKATIDDIAILVKFNKLLALESEGKELNENTLYDGVKSLFTNRMQGFYLLAEADGQVAGQLMITFESSDWRNGIFWWIQSVYVDEQLRQQGIFSSMYNHVEEMAKASGDCCGLRLYVEMNNLHAQEVYFRKGMHKTHYFLLEKDFRNKG